MRFSAVILAEGHSRRMGRDKSWINVEGEPLLARQVKLARRVGAAEVLISGRPGVDYSISKCPVVLDKWPECGPLAGIERGLQAAKAELVLVMAVDLPHLDESFLSTMLSQGTEKTGVVPCRGQKVEPLAAVYVKSAHSQAVRLLKAGRYAMREFAAICEMCGLVKWWQLPCGMGRSTEQLELPGDVPQEDYRKVRLSPSLRVRPSRSSFSSSGTTTRRLAPNT